MGALRLEVVDYQDPDHWRWRLTDAQGTFVADHQVTLGPSEPEYLGFVDLAGFLQDRAVPDRRLASEAELVERVGRWVGMRVLGEEVGHRLVDAGPVVVEVVLPEDADFLLYRPLELAHVGGVPLAVQDVSLAFQVQGEAAAGAKDPVAGRLRLLAVFSLPTGGTALALRRERYALVRLIRSIATRYRRAVEVAVLQYGVTRQRLGSALREGAGWDVVHFSGHGLADGLVLEREDGTADLVATPELVGLLRPARQRLKLVCLSSCLSAAATAAETRRWLELVVPDQLQAEAAASAMAKPLPGLARELVAKLGCAVVAMRFPVVDDFAIALDEHLYEGLLGQDHTLARALQLALPQAAGERPSVRAPALSVATPALFGPLAADLRLVPPRGEPDFNVNTAKTSYFPDEPARFVGRVGVLARASMVLAPRNQQGRNAVVLHGMAGAGKTACALELAYRHEPVFGALVWWQAPEQGREIAGSLRDLAMALEAQLPGLAMVQATTSSTELARFLPRLTQLLEDNAVLLVLDNLESLLTPEGSWRDPAWEQLVTALLSHGGESRLVLTSRVRPQGLDGRVLVEPIHALSLDEALLLARELPNLGRLLRTDGAGTRGQEQTESGVVLVRRVLQVVQGHPKLLELADAQAADPQLLRARLAEAEQTLPGADRLGAFFAEGESALAPEQFLETLAGWTRGVAGVLPEGARVLLGVVCALEEPDRTEPILEVVWPSIWRRLGHQGDPPPLAATIAALQEQALVHAEQPSGPDQDGPVGYRVHPGVAEAARSQAGPELQAAVDEVLAAVWQALYRQAREAEGGEAGGMVVHAGRAAAPYLLRLRDWAAAGTLLEQALVRDRSPATVAALLPLLRQIAQATRGTDRELIGAGNLARVMGWFDPVEGERQLREVLAAAITQQRYDYAAAAAGDLVNLLRQTGRLRQALALVDDLEDYNRQAGFGPWTQLLNRRRRLHLLYLLGEHERVLAEVQQLRGDQLATLPETSDQDERVRPWHVRETILQTGTFAARELGRWELALELNAAATRSLVDRDAPALDQARSRFNDYPPLLELGRLQEARALLHSCRAVYQAEGALAELGRVFGALAALEDQLGHQQDAIAMTQAALRYLYAAGNPDSVAVGHHNLANSLRRAEDDPALVVAHRLAAALLRYQTGSGGLASTLRSLAGELAEFGEPAVPMSFEELDRRVRQVEGVRLAELLASVPGPADDGDTALAEVLRLAREQPAQPPDAGAGLLEQWEPVLAGVVAAARGDPEARAAIEPLLAELGKDRDWVALAGVLRRVVAGDRGQQLLGGLDQTDAQLVAEVLRRLEGGG